MSHIFGLGPHAAHTMQAEDGEGGKVVVQNDTDKVILVKLDGDESVLAINFLNIEPFTPQQMRIIKEVSDFLLSRQEFAAYGRMLATACGIAVPEPSSQPPLFSTVK